MTPAADALAQSVATGGSGGDGGLPGASNGTFSGVPGDGGGGGNAVAGSGVSNDGGTARATATATGGAAGSSVHKVLGGAANAEANATGLGDATAEARAIGGTSMGSTGGSPDGALATAHASATSASGDATATAEARGGDWQGEFGIAGGGAPTAQAFAPNGDASAIARSIGGNGYNGGAAFIDTTAASGGASGTLTLIQEAIGGDSPAGALGLGFNRGNARSSLSAVNTYGGALHAESIARSGANGFAASAHVDGVSHSDAPVEVHALAVGRRPIADAQGFANAGADLVAASRTMATNSDDQHSASGIGLFGGPDHLGSGARVDKAHSPLRCPTRDPARSIRPPVRIGRRRRSTCRRSRRGAPARTCSSIRARPTSRHGVAGNPEVQANLDAGGEILGLGSVALRGDSTLALSYTGSLDLRST